MKRFATALLFPALVICLSAAAGEGDGSVLQSLVPGNVRGMTAIELHNPVQPTPGACTDTNTNQAYNLGWIKVKEPLHFVYSTYREPQLAASEEGVGDNEVFRAIKRAMATVESAIQGATGKEQNLFSVSVTDEPIDQSQVDDTGEIFHFDLVDNNYSSYRQYSGDGINSIVWVDFTQHPELPLIHENVGAITFSVWNEAGEIIERDILLQANEFNHWAINADLTKVGPRSIDCSDNLDVQGVITHLLAHAVGLRPVNPDGDASNGDETDSTMWDIGGIGRYVLSNFGMPTQRWQTLTPGDIQGLAEAAPEKGAKFTPPLEDVVEDAAQIVLHYDFEDISGGLVRDQSGNGIDGAIVGAAAQTPGPDGMAIDLSAGQYINLDGPSFPRNKIPQDAFTLAAWLNVPAAVIEHEPTIFAANSPLGYNSNTHFLVPPGFVVYTYADSDTSHPLIPTIDFPLVFAPVPAGWFHYALSYDRAAGKATLYINGIWAGELLVNDAPLASSWAGGAFIGQWVDPPFWPLLGLMDEFVLANYAMDADAINDLKNGVLP